MPRPTKRKIIASTAAKIAANAHKKSRHDIECNPTLEQQCVKENLDPEFIETDEPVNQPQITHASRGRSRLILKSQKDRRRNQSTGGRKGKNQNCGRAHRDSSDEIFDQVCSLVPGSPVQTAKVPPPIQVSSATKRTKLSLGHDFLTNIPVGEEPESVILTTSDLNDAVSQGVCKYYNIALEVKPIKHKPLRYHEDKHMDIFVL